MSSCVCDRTTRKRRTRFRGEEDWIPQPSTGPNRLCQPRGIVGAALQPPDLGLHPLSSSKPSCRHRAVNPRCGDFGRVPEITQRVAVWSSERTRWDDNGSVVRCSRAQVVGSGLQSVAHVRVSIPIARSSIQHHHASHRRHTKLVNPHPAVVLLSQAERVWCPHS
jgi:hypothetical protein